MLRSLHSDKYDDDDFDDDVFDDDNCIAVEMDSDVDEY